jgi:hypothetical protein
MKLKLKPFEEFAFSFPAWMFRRIKTDDPSKGSFDALS